MADFILPLIYSAAIAIGIVGLVALLVRSGVVPLKSVDELARQQRWMTGLKGFPYRKRGRVLSLAEERFAHTLLEAIGEDYFPMSKVRLADVLEVTVQGKGFYPAFNQIAQKHVDFLLCDPESSAPLLAIELDDRSHGGKRARERDAFKTEALQAAGLPLLRVAVASEYKTAWLKQSIEEALSRHQSTKAFV